MTRDDKRAYYARYDKEATRRRILRAWRNKLRSMENDLICRYQPNEVEDVSDYSPDTGDEEEMREIDRPPWAIRLNLYGFYKNVNSHEAKIRNITPVREDRAFKRREKYRLEQEQANFNNNNNNNNSNSNSMHDIDHYLAIGIELLKKRIRK